MTESTPVSIEDIITGNLDKFSVFHGLAERVLKDLSLELPAEFYEYLKEELLELLLAKGQRIRLKLKLVIDSTAIIQDSFRVAKGKPSSTERFLSSAFVEMIAPPNILEEVAAQIRKKLPRGASLEKALNHAKSLLSRVKIATARYEAYEEARRLISSRIAGGSQGDLYFLGLAIETEADAVISSDKKAFDNLPRTRRWELVKTVQVVQTFETGALTLFVAGVGIELSSKIFLQTLAFLLRAVSEVMQIVVSVTGIIIGKTLDAISSLPKWALALILGALASVLILAVVNEDFQGKVKETISKSLDAIKTMFSSLLEEVDYLWRGFKELVILIWNLAAPVVVPGLIVIVGVALESIVGLVRQAQGNFEGFTSIFDTLNSSKPGRE
jgi:predicted nucleic acid-binding protein